ncbi:MAG: pyridoxamine 5'-phosphate oxidase family protein [Verrucomicrobiota bacterium]
MYRIPARGHYDRETVYAIIDEAPLCHIGFSMGEQSFVMPTIHVRDGDALYFHGANKSRLIQLIESGAGVCMTFTLLDGLVIARSVVHNSMNYRSVVSFGRGWKLEDDEAKMEAFRLLTDKLLPGRWDDCKLPTQSEMNMTAVVAVKIEDASAKIRTGPPIDVEGDYDLDYWAGVLPLKTVIESPVDDPRLKAGIGLPGYLG